MSISTRNVTDPDPDPARIRAKFWIRIRTGSSEFVLPDPILKNNNAQMLIFLKENADTFCEI